MIKEVVNILLVKGKMLFISLFKTKKNIKHFNTEYLVFSAYMYLTRGGPL